MKLTLKRIVVAGNTRIEDEIHLDDDNPILTQYNTQNKEMIMRIVNFPFVEFLCRQIFSDQSEKEQDKK